MTRFTKENLHKDGDYIFYAEPADKWNSKKQQFIARFKRMPGAGSFMTHLRKYWTLEDYLAKRETMSPIDVVKETGYLQPHIKKWLKEGGYPVTPAGWAQKLEDDVAKRYGKATTQ